jgi:hypothetical protein
MDQQQQENQSFVVMKLSEDQMEQIADIVIEKLEARVGRAAIKRAAWLVGLVLTSLISLVTAKLTGWL